MSNTHQPSKDSKGRYFRNLGRVLRPEDQAQSLYPRSTTDYPTPLENKFDDTGRRLIGFESEPSTEGLSQKKFYLGRDEESAKLANLKLESLWRAICERHNRIFPGKFELQTPDGVKIEDAMASGDFSFELVQPKPIWDPTTLQIADAIREGKPVATVTAPKWLFEPARLNIWTSEREKIPSIGMWLEALRTDFPMIHIVLKSGDMTEDAELQIQQQAESLVQRGNKMMMRPHGGQKLHTALKAFVVWHRKQNTQPNGTASAWSQTLERQINFIQRNCENIDLNDLTSEAIDTIVITLRKRPITFKGKQASTDFATNCLKAFKRFLKFLDRNESFTWMWPYHFDYVVGKVAITDEEKSEPVHKLLVETYEVDDLKLLWSNAVPLQRLYMVLALNCGFTATDLTTLTLEHIILKKPNPLDRQMGTRSKDSDSWIIRRRNKTDVFGCWKLWPATVEAIEWWQARRKLIKAEVDNLLVTAEGLPYSDGVQRSGRIPNTWNTLRTRIEKKDSHFTGLSFKYLRKTGSNFIRRDFGGEIASIYLAHGRPVKKDQLMEVYANRPFNKLFEALDGVNNLLEPVWSSESEPFPAVEKLGGRDNVTASQISKIRRMRKQGFQIKKIAEEMRLDPSTVSRHSRSKGSTTDA